MSIQNGPVSSRESTAEGKALCEEERWLLLALTLLIARQRALNEGSEGGVLDMLTVPREFFFHWRSGDFRCEFERGAPEMFRSGVVVVEERGFVAPVSAVAPHIRISNAASGERVEAALSTQFIAESGLVDGDTAYALYSPLQVLYCGQTGFFLPHRERWHSFACRALATRYGGAARRGDSDSQVAWAESTLSLGEGREGPRLASLYSEGLSYSVEMAPRGFNVHAQCSSTAGLFRNLLAFCSQGPLPVGVRAWREGANAVRVVGGG